MLIEIDFNSDEAIYQQLRNQIILGIATSTLTEGEALPSVRQMADTIGINMHTVNKTYSLLRQEGYIKLDRRRGAVVAVDADELRAKAEVERELRGVLARAVCRGVSADDIHAMVDGIYKEYVYNEA
ncbi:GntR family transcriptional regulator [Lachnoclostridium sp. Marseille-P6806]|uniref:GntR family transcriptional regulator n=1 Tax=Lachnoclostridium sp. Marseille-P6806 TaxID=2364793 RepID=UPI001031637A|nr:GntR family transcriptional regulator [Lachnoclostridium sp. Marseille-P6806]